MQFKEGEQNTSRIVESKKKSPVKERPKTLHNSGEFK
jgi:hypothetical protein